MNLHRSLDLGLVHLDHEPAPVKARVLGWQRDPKFGSALVAIAKSGVLDQLRAGQPITAVGVDGILADVIGTRKERRPPPPRHQDPLLDDHSPLGTELLLRAAKFLRVAIEFSGERLAGEIVGVDRDCFGVHVSIAGPDLFRMKTARPIRVPVHYLGRTVHLAVRAYSDTAILIEDPAAQIGAVEVTNRSRAWAPVVAPKD